MRRQILLFIAGSLVLWIASCKDGDETNTSKSEEMKEIKQTLDISNLDTTANPGEDFNQYANGGWKSKHPIPADKGRFGNFDLLRDSTDKQVKTIIDEVAAADNEIGSIGAKIADFYNTGMDTASIEEKGLSVLEGEFAKINAIKTKEDVQAQIIYNHSRFISSLFGIYVGADSKNSTMMITHIYQGGTGLPDRDYYIKGDKRFKEIREKYVEHLQKIFILAGDDEATAQKNAKTVMRLEMRMAKAQMDREDRRDPHKTYNKMSVKTLKSKAPGINWEAYFKGVGIEQQEDLIVAQPAYIAEAAKMIQTVPVEDWKIYFRHMLLHKASSYLNKAFVDQDFDFFGRTMSGIPEMRPRWQRVIAKTSSALGEAVGQKYVEKYFPPEAKARMQELIKNLMSAMNERIQNLTWMGEETKKNALEKLSAITVKVGYPDKWKDYSQLKVEKDSYFMNILRYGEFEFADMISKTGKPVDKTLWEMSPQTVNAYYNPVNNEIVFPAGILQPPFFFMNGDDAINYGAIGVVIGHEMTHGFDDKGRLYDKDGNLNSWWTEEDNQNFKKRAKVLSDQFDSFIVLGDVHANGTYTMGENLADLGGVNISYTAFEKTPEAKANKKIDGFTPAQRFFLAYSNVWAQNIRDKEMLRLTQEDVHSLGKYRVNGPLRNVAAFHKAFNIKEGDYMFLPEEQRAIIW